MGSGRWDGASRATYSTFTDSIRGKSTEDVYTRRGLDPSLDPKGVTVRESRDSAENPRSTPAIIALDVTGSMGMLADNIARTGLGTLFTSILDQKPVSDPHIMFMGIGDAEFDTAPLQVSQFEADKKIIDQLTKLYLEHGGGGNNYESYTLAWYFAAFHTVHDAMEKRGEKGYLFTVGDEEVSEPFTRAQLQQFLGDTVEADLKTRDMLNLVQRVYNVYHIIIEEGSHARAHLPRVQMSWRHYLGQNVISLSDHTKLAETIVTALQIANGRMEADAAAALWGDEATAKVVRAAVKSLPRAGDAATGSAQ